MKNNVKLLAIPIVIFIVSSILLYFAMVNHWFGESREGLMKFCEFARDGLVKQPANSYSNLGFSVVALVISYQAFKGKFSNRNSINDIPFYTILFCIGLIITGAGSFAMHATNTHWGGFGDLLGMFLLAGFASTYAITRLLSLSKFGFTALFLISVGFSSFVYLTPSLNFEGYMSGAEVCFIVMAVGGVLIELYLIYGRGIKTQSKYAFLFVGTMALSFFIWNLSLWPHSLLCKPHSLIQGHLFWHLLDALAAYFGFLYYASEQAPAKIK